MRPQPVGHKLQHIPTGNESRQTWKSSSAAVMYIADTAPLSAFDYKAVPVYDLHAPRCPLCGREICADSRDCKRCGEII